MRQISIDAAEALFNMTTFSRSNTKVTREDIYGNGSTIVFKMTLFGNDIAHYCVEYTSSGEIRTKRLHIKDGGWKTRTTKDRLQAILKRIDLRIESLSSKLWYVQGRILEYNIWMRVYENDNDIFSMNGRVKSEFTKDFSIFSKGEGRHVLKIRTENTLLKHEITGDFTHQELRLCKERHSKNKIHRDHIKSIK